MATRRVRIVCISDTHNQTPKLPAGDILVHAGDLTNQGSYAELKKMVEWLEKSEFETKIVVAGNHDTTLDSPFFHSNQNKWKWPSHQDPSECRNLLMNAPSITYLEHSSTMISIISPTGQETRLKVFGSPYSPGRRGWAFQYSDDADAENLWGAIEDDVDIVVTHTPARGHCDTTVNSEMAGCEVLKRRLEVMRPMLHVCGHIHDGRGVERVRWGECLDEPERSSLEHIEYWKDPGRGNKKISLVDLTAKGTMKLDKGNETCIVNAAILGAREVGKAMVVNKPIVVDIEVPVQECPD
ncbi:ser/Thr protein phosphatase [Plenodomus tracheiphilus IPT5]|uniref:Ser/Thr protein phosphatase n=1 Tax=Plenodomus tracheiphilus IPT5 TaxID=1408161 RepID=A0A6A7ASA6_9PLEO|nr:ser/Thr protein phosphatase [Plenodomus tracheiphilus IPT5]